MIISCKYTTLIGDCDTGSLQLVNGTSMFEECVQRCYYNNWESNTNARVVSI